MRRIMKCSQDIHISCNFKPQPHWCMLMQHKRDSRDQCLNIFQCIIPTWLETVIRSILGCYRVTDEFSLIDFLEVSVNFYPKYYCFVLWNVKLLFSVYDIEFFIELISQASNVRHFCFFFFVLWEKFVLKFNLLYFSLFPTNCISLSVSCRSLARSTFLLNGGDRNIFCENFFVDCKNALLAPLSSHDQWTNVSVLLNFMNEMTCAISTFEPFIMCQQINIITLEF